MKKRSTQHRKSRVKKSGELICTIFLVIGGFYFLFRSIDSTYLLKNWSHSNIVEYRGHYSIEEQRPFRITVIIFDLDNDMDFSVPSTTIEKENQLIHSHESGEPIPLCFRFLTGYSPFSKGEYSIISITSEDGITYIDDTVSYQGLDKASRIYCLVGLSLLTPVFILSSLWYIGKGKDIIRRNYKRIVRRIKGKNRGSKKLPLFFIA